MVATNDSRFSKFLEFLDVFFSSLKVGVSLVLHMGCAPLRFLIRLNYL
jgi:hypothetical protein